MPTDTFTFRTFPRVVTGHGAKINTRITELKPCNYEADGELFTSESPVRAFRAYVDGAMYDLQVTARRYHRDYLEEDNNDNWQFTVTVFGWAAEKNASCGVTYRFTFEHIFGPDFAEKMDITEANADAVLLVLRACGHSVRTCAEHREKHQLTHGDLQEIVETEMAANPEGVLNARS